MNIHCLQHVAFETPGTIIDWATQNNHSISYTYFFEKNHTLPSVNNIDALLIMGGCMNVDEEEKFPWLKIEKQFINECIISQKKVLGICLGAQLIAAALGSKVYKGVEKEIGFFPISFINNSLQHKLFHHFSKGYTVFHWHGDTFDLPANAQLIASTNICKNQAYLIGANVLGLQFHFEMDETIIEQMLLHDAEELNETGNFIQPAAQIRSGYHWLAQNKKDMFVLLDNFFKMTT